MSEDERPGMADDVRRLAGGVQEWLRSVLPEPEQLHTGPDCQWCPLCQFAEVVRGDHPEVAEKITEAGAAIVNAVRAMFEAASAPPAKPADESRPRPRPRPHSTAPHVEHIKLDAAE